MTSARRLPVASGVAAPYLPAMVALRLTRFLTLLALLLAPLGMVRAHAAMAIPADASASAHHGGADPCGGMDRPAGQQPSSGIDCGIACSAMPSGDSEIAAHPMVAAAVPTALLAADLHGLHPESDPPPPRFA